MKAKSGRPCRVLASGWDAGGGCCCFCFIMCPLSSSRTATCSMITLAEDVMESMLLASEGVLPPPGWKAGSIA